MSFAVATISGRLVRDPEQKDIGSGSVTSFTVACDQYNGKGKDKTAQFWDCECWSPAQAVLKYFGKGDPISVSGTLRQDRPPPKGDGPARTFYKLRIEQVGTLPPRGDTGSRKESEPQDDDPF
jgi:single-stranded DNA-binding protein